MIPEYKLFHGAVLSELIDKSLQDLSIGELHENGRLFSYTLNGEIGIQIKHSSKRLSPWQFTFTRQNAAELFELRKRFNAVFGVFVCGTVGFVALTLDEMVQLMSVNESNQAFIRVQRNRGSWFSVTGSGGKLQNKKPSGIIAVLQELGPAFYAGAENSCNIS